MNVPADCRIAVLVPCYNEATTIAAVVGDFRAALPSATVYVYDNNSTDGTAFVAHGAGAVVRRETLQGKGNVVRRMFADVEADVYVMVDGDDTYDAAAAPTLIEALVAGPNDMIGAVRIATGDLAFRAGHRFGNRLLTGLVTTIFGKRTTDMLTGYRAFSRRFVKTFPALSRGFEIETELMVHALELGMPMAEVDTAYRERPPGSASKLSTFKDGFRIMALIGKLVKEERPLQFFTLAASLLAAVSVGLSLPLLETYVASGLVPRLPTAVLSAALMILAFLALACGLVLETVTRGRREMKRLRYLELPAPVAAPRVAPIPDGARNGRRADDALPADPLTAAA
jgi:hypothetical protein